MRTPHLRGALAITYATSVAVSGGASLLYPALPAVASDLRVDPAEIGLAIAIFTAPAIVLAPLFGVLADLKGRRWLLILGLALFGAAGSAAALAPSYNWLLALRMLQGIGMSAIMPLTIVLISDLLPPERELRGQGMKVVIDRVAMIVLPVLGGLLAALSWRLAFMPFLLTLPLAFAAYVWMPETNGGNSDALKPYLRRTLLALRERRLRVAFGAGFLRFFLDYALYTYLPLLLALRYGASAVTAGWLIALSAMGAIVTATTVHRIDERHPPERLLALAFFVSAVALALTALDPPLWLLALALFAFGLGNGWISPLQKSLLTRRTDASLRGGVISVDRVIQQAAKSLAPALIGVLLLVAQLEMAFWLLAAVSLLGSLALLWAGPARRG